MHRPSRWMARRPGPRGMSSVGLPGSLWWCGTALLGMVCLMVGGAPVLGAEPPRVAQVALDEFPDVVGLLPWRGGTALYVFTSEHKKKKRAAQFSLFAVGKGAPRLLHRWKPPGGMRHVEPWRLGGETGWLALVGATWQIGRMRGDAPVWEALCGCPHGYSNGGNPRRGARSLLADLDGDGVEEFLLPGVKGLSAYRVQPEGGGGTLLWEAPWDASGKPLPAPVKAHKGYSVPEYQVSDVEGDGKPDLIIPLGGALRVLPLRGTEAPVLYEAALPGLPKPSEDGRLLMLAHEDLDGDGVVDILHADIRDFGDALDQENHLRFFPGGITGGRLRFGKATHYRQMSGGSFAQVGRGAVVGPGEKAPVWLMLATTEVSFSTVMKALATGEVRMKLETFAIAQGAVTPGPLHQGEVTFTHLKDEGRRPLILLADLDGDGRREYLLNLAPDALSIYPGTASNPLAEAPMLVPGVVLPPSPSQVLRIHRDGAGGEALLYWHRTPPPGGGSPALYVLER